ncbi:hypothetical protein ACFL2Q_15415 [Thermodesulfobacteriota bacterium]
MHKRILFCVLPFTVLLLAVCAVQAPAGGPVPTGPVYPGYGGAPSVCAPPVAPPVSYQADCGKGHFAKCCASVCSVVGGLFGWTPWHVCLLHCCRKPNSPKKTCASPWPACYDGLGVPTPAYAYGGYPPHYAYPSAPMGYVGMGYGGSPFYAGTLEKVGIPATTN